MKTWEQQAREGEQAAQIRRAPRIKQRPMFATSIALGLLGLAAVIIGGLVTPVAWLGYLLIICAGLVDRKHWICGACGNKVERTSSLCPVCRCSLS